MNNGDIKMDRLQVFKNRFKPNKLIQLFISLFLSLSLIIVFITGIGYFSILRTFNTVVAEFNYSTIANINAALSSRFSVGENLAQEIYHIVKLIDLSEKADFRTPENLYNAGKVIAALQTGTNRNESISVAYVYLSRSDTIISDSGIYEARYFYDTYIPHYNMSYEEWKASFTALQQPVYCNSLLSFNTHDLDVIEYYQPFNIYASDSYGCVVLHYDKTFLLDSLSSITLLHDANTQIRYMPADTVIFSSGDNDIGTYIREQMLTSGTHMLKDTPFGELIAFKQISLDRNWEFTTSLSTDIFYSTTSSFTQLVIFFIALQIIIGILLTILFSVQSYSPIRRMLSKLHNITDEFFTPSQTLEFDEIEQITRRLVGDRNHLKAEIDEMYPMLLKGLLLQILNGNRSERDCALNYTVQFADYFPHEGFACAKISVEDNRGFAQDDSLTEMQLTRLVIRNITEELLSVHQPVVSIDSDIRNVVIVFNFPWCEEKTALEQTMQTLISELKKAQMLIAERFEIYTNIGLSQPLPGISNLYKCHLQAQSALTYKTGSNVYDLTYYNETQTNESTYSYSLDTEIYLMSSAKVGDYEKVVHILNTLTEENASVIASKTAAVFRCFIMALYGTLLRLCEELSVSPEALGIDIPKRLSLNYSSNIMHQIHKDYESICHWVNQSKKSHNDILKEQIIGYIHEHCYDNSLSLVSVADHIGINPTYLSSFIKEQIGETFLTYVLNLRMERAKELLRSTNLSQHEIAVRIGYANSGVFLRVFKKKYGLTPGAYRQQQHK